MHPTEVFDQDTMAPPAADGGQRRVIVELDCNGKRPGRAARVMEAPPDVLVMFVESKEATASGSRTIAVGGSGAMLASDEYTTLTSDWPQPRQIAVSFPG